MEKAKTCINIRKDLKKRALKAIDKGKFPGISSLSGLIEQELEDVIKKVEGT